MLKFYDFASYKKARDDGTISADTPVKLAGDAPDMWPLRYDLAAARAERDQALAKYPPNWPAAKDYWKARAVHASAEISALRAEMERLKRSNAAFRANGSETWSAMNAMRDSLNEYIPMPSLESDLLQGPENSVFCATVASAVIAHLTGASAASGGLCADGQEGGAE